VPFSVPELARMRPSLELHKLELAVACMHLYGGDGVPLLNHGTEIITALWMQLLIQVPEELNLCHIVKSKRGKETLG